MDNAPLRPERGWLVRYSPVLKGLLILAVVVVLSAWWLNTPAGLLGKADAAGYAVCHRIASHSFRIGGRQLPLCARCSGMYLSALLGVAYLTSLGKRGGMPPFKISVVLGLFLLLFAVDGVNSYLHFFPGAPDLYQPENWLRLLTGTGVGLGIAAVLVPVTNQVFWQHPDPRPALAGWRQFIPLLGLAAVLDLAILSDAPLLLYPLAVLSAVAIFLILAMVYAVVWMMIFRRPNCFQRYRELWVPLLGGFLTALLQIGAFDAFRFFLTHTWAGFNL